MRIQRTQLTDVLLLVPLPHRDDRGLFTRTFDALEFDEYLESPGLSATFIQDSQSRSYRGVIRGMHGRSGSGEAKLVRCAHGAIYDVLVDMRRDKPTFGQMQAFRLDDENFHHLYVPSGFLHGFQALSDVADVCYRIDRAHDPAENIAVAFDDPDLGIDWPLPPTVISERDAHATRWADLRRRLG
ncbi:dTDP-4-dehydrorhamnose 3,5-epimerase [Mycolicibacterium vaccae]|uniref:dTDP-4-dehydrorhamnose 3,5-epimerase n=1 Tax=Mycolicibacterium vaccae TaxID=1810 RepID=UPI003D04F2DE